MESREGCEQGSEEGFQWNVLVGAASPSFSHANFTFERPSSCSLALTLVDNPLGGGTGGSLHWEGGGGMCIRSEFQAMEAYVFRSCSGAVYELFAL